MWLRGTHGKDKNVNLKITRKILNKFINDSSKSYDYIIISEYFDLIFRKYQEL